MGPRRHPARRLLWRTALATWLLLVCGCPSPEGEDCGSGICGCWHDVTLSFSATVVDRAGDPLAGIELYCFGEASPIATSGADGVLAFTIETREAPGCGYERCRNLRITDPNGQYEEQETTAHQANGETLTLTATADAG